MEMVSQSRLDLPEDESSSTLSLRYFEGSQANYFEDIDNNFFGISKKEYKRIASDFRFDIVGEIRKSCKGYVLKIYSEKKDNTNGESSWLCYISSEAMSRKGDFLNSINSAPRGKGVMCSLQEVQLCDFLLQKKRSLTEIPEKYIIKTVGRQSNGMWAISPNLTLSSSGTIIQDCPFIWVTPNKFTKSQIDLPDYTPITAPLETSNLIEVFNDLEAILQHNFFAGLMVISSCVMALHYEVFMKLYCNCPVPIAFGPSGTGKTTALRCGLAIVGSACRFFTSSSSNSRPFFLSQCSKSSMPIGIDDPSFQGDIEKLVIDLFNGAKTGSISRGENKPLTTAIISANFRGSEKERYSSRCLLIEFSGQLDCSVKQYTDFTAKIATASCALGFCISLGEEFEKSGIEEMDTQILPLFRTFLSSTSPTMMPRVLPGYATLYWFALKLLKVSGREATIDDLNSYVKSKIIPTILEFQSSGEAQLSSLALVNPSQEIDNLIEHIILCLENCTKKKVQSCIRFDVTFNQKKAIAIRPENIPNIDWKIYNNTRDSLRRKDDLASYRQCRDFGQKRKEKCMLLVTKFIKEQLLHRLKEVCYISRRSVVSDCSPSRTTTDNDSCFTDSSLTCTPSVDIPTSQRDITSLEDKQESDLEVFANSLLSPPSKIIETSLNDVGNSEETSLNNVENSEETSLNNVENSEESELMDDVRITSVSNCQAAIQQNEVSAVDDNFCQEQKDNDSNVDSRHCKDHDKNSENITDSSSCQNHDRTNDIKEDHQNVKTEKKSKRPYTRSQGTLNQFSKKLCFDKELFD